MRSSLRWISSAVLAAVLGLAGFVPTPAHGRDVTMCTLNWEPFYGDDLPRQGFFTALVRAAFDRGGHNAETLQFMSWARAQLEVKQGDRDVAMGGYMNEYRDKTFLMSDPVYSTDVGLMTLEKTGVDSFDTLRDLSDYTIGYGRGFTVNEEFDNADYLDKEPTEKLDDSVRKLFAGRVDMVAGGLDNIRYATKKAGHDVDRLVAVKPVLKHNTLHIMVSRAIPDGEKIVSDFNRGLEEIREDGTYDQILKEMGYK